MCNHCDSDKLRMQLANQREEIFSLKKELAELKKEEKLKPCPICGCDQAKLVEMDAYWWVMCQMCGTRVPRTKPEPARAMWNKLDR
jgi:hypothetical protein